MSMSMSLREKLAAFKTQFQSGRPPFEGVPREVHATLARHTAELVAAGAAESVVKSGVAPAFELQDAEGRTVRLGDLLATGPVVLSFYRGAWCGYCNIDLEEIELHAAQIRAAGATIVAITPQTPANSRKLIAARKLSFPILSDPGNVVAARYGLRYTLPGYLNELFLSLGVSLPAFNGEASFTLAIPARYVIDRGGQIRYGEAHPDYTVRPEPAEWLPVLESLGRAQVA